VEAPAPPPAPSPDAELPPARPPDPDTVLSGKPTQEEAVPRKGWFDRGHRLIERIFFAPVVRLDEFFEDQGNLYPEPSNSFVRFRNSLRLSDQSKPVYTPELLATLRFPRMDNWLDRFRVVIAGAADDTLDNLFGGSNATSPRFRDGNAANAELRFGAYRGTRSTADVGVGLVARLPVGAFARARYRLAIPVGKVFLSRSSYSVFWRTDTHLGTRLDSSLERHLGESTLVRLAGSTQVAQRRTRDLEYGGDLSLLHAFTETSAIALGGGLSGATRAPVAIDRYRLFTRGRQAALRRWIFLELEPELSWPWREGRGRIREYAVTLRLEVQFQDDPAVERAAERRVDRLVN